MADFFDAVAAIQARLLAGWDATPTDRLRFDNGPYFDPGADLAPWVQVEIIGDVDLAYPGRRNGGLCRVDGLILLHLMVPTQTGSSGIASLYRNARDLLAHQSFAGVTVNGLSPHGGRPASEDGNYHGVTATAPFFAIYEG